MPDASDKIDWNVLHIFYVTFYIYKKKRKKRSSRLYRKSVAPIKNTCYYLKFILLMNDLVMNKILLSCKKCNLRELINPLETGDFDNKFYSYLLYYYNYRENIYSFFSSILKWTLAMLFIYMKIRRYDVVLLKLSFPNY